MAPTETEPGLVLGTVGYMSPEQVRGQQADHRADIFSFGAVLYEMLAGRRAFQGASAADTMSAILKEDPPALVAMDPMIPPVVERVVRHCLEKDPATRFQSVRDLAFDLQAFPEVSRPTPRRSRLWAWSVIGVAVVTVVISAIWLGRGVRSPDLSSTAEPSAPRSFAQQPDIASVAVLPFTDMSAEKDQEYFSDGVAEELLNSLAKIPGLRVTGRTSSFSFKGKNEDLRVIGQKLNVGAILEGSVRKAGKQVRITAQLVNTADGFHLWSETYDRTFDDIFAVQEDIARSVTSALKVIPLLGGNAPQHEASSNAEAYNTYLQGRYFHDKAEYQKAAEYYQQALTIDSTYALAWAWLSFAYSDLANNGVLFSPAVGYEKAREAAEKSLKLDESLAMAHEAMGRASSSIMTGTGRVRNTSVAGHSNSNRKTVGSSDKWHIKHSAWLYRGHHSRAAGLGT